MKRRGFLAGIISAATAIIVPFRSVFAYPKEQAKLLAGLMRYSFMIQDQCWVFVYRRSGKLDVEYHRGKELGESRLLLTTAPWRSIVMHPVYHSHLGQEKNSVYLYPARGISADELTWQEVIDCFLLGMDIGECPEIAGEDCGRLHGVLPSKFIMDAREESIRSGRSVDVVAAEMVTALMNR